MTETPGPPSVAETRWPRPPVPLIRHLSAYVTPVLVRLPVTPNQATAISLMLGLGACWFAFLGGFERLLASAVLLVLSYVFDNCDGEIAHIKNQRSEFGAKFDSFVDWIVHALFFAALGAGVFRETGNALWLWLGIAGAAGGTINYLAVLIIESRSAWMCARRGEQRRWNPKSLPVPRAGNNGACSYSGSSFAPTSASSFSPSGCSMQPGFCCQPRRLARKCIG